MTVQKGPNKYSKYSFLVIVLISAIVLSYAIKNPLGQDVKQVSYSEFLDALDQKQVKEVVIVNHTGKVKGKMADDSSFVTDAPDDKELVNRLRDSEVPFSAENPGMRENFTSFLTVIIVPAAIILVFWLLIMRQANVGGSQAMSFGRSRAKVLNENLPKVTFKDVAGVDEAKEELEEIVEFLKDPQRFQTLGAKIPKGVLMVGAPGTGKTLLARAIAGEAGVPFMHMSGSDFVEMFVGVGASRVRDLFEQAKKSAPCLVFVDEIDAVGRQRGAGLGGGHDEREQTLNQLLVEMDGFDANIGVILIAATNRPDVLDPALLRPGRFDRRIVVDRPDLNGRREILDVHARGKPIDHDVDMQVIARRTPGFTGADLENVLNEAAILAARESSASVRMSHIEESIERVIAGPERRSRLMPERERRNTAYHEAGHALVAKLLPNSDPVHKISILPRGMALGYTLQLPLEDKYSKLSSELLDEVCVLLGGRAAERLMLDEISTGAANDIERASKIVRRMVCEFGMSEELGPITYGKKDGAVFLGRDLGTERDFSEEVAARIDAEVRRIFDDCMDKVQKLLSENKDRLELVTEKLMQHETLDGVRLEKLLDGEDLPDDEIERLEARRRKKMEKEREQREREEKEKEEQEESENASENVAAKSTDPQPEVSDDGEEKETVSSTRVDTIIPAEDGTSGMHPQELVSTGGLLGRFNSLLNETFENNFQPKIEELNDDEASVIKASSSPEDEPGLLNRAIVMAQDDDLRAALHVRLALVYIKLERADLVADELMAALHCCSDRMEKKSRNVLVSSISYFRIIHEELRRNSLKLNNLPENDQIVRRIDGRYRQWEKKAAASSSPFFPMT